MKIAIVDYGLGNLRSIEKAFKKIYQHVDITRDINDLKKAEKIILPGVGHYKTGMINLKSMGIEKVLYNKVMIEKTPILGICLGMQLFCNYSEEGDCNGLGWIDANVVKFRVSNKIKYKIPHIGWNSLNLKQENQLKTNVEQKVLFYFVHSYHIECNDISDIWMTTNYDYEFVSGIKRGNIYGVQFHPEKSHDAGLELLKNFSIL